MNTSSKFVVATHILAAIIIRQKVEGRPVPVKSNFLSDSVNTNPVVIRRILGKLREASLVDSKGGKDGGSWLTRSPENITLSTVYEAVEDGDLCRHHYSTPDQCCPVGSTIQEIMSGHLYEAERAMKASLAKTTLRQITEDIFERSGVNALLAAGKSYMEIAQMLRANMEAVS